MSYKALYRTYRPEQFNDVVGQEHIVKTLKNIMQLDKVSHAYLFAGPRGTGKTSIAHIFAKNLNCQDHQDKTTHCLKCASCLEKNNLDIIEIDAASNNGVSEIRNVIENSKYAPSISRYKVYIIDEVHMLSKGAFNALLKTLEEPPEHVIFILATTEPHKIPVTILSRTQRFNFKRISNEEIIKRLKFVLDKENIKYDQASLNLIANLAKGGMRDALSIADQGSAYSNDGLVIDELSKVFGVLSNTKIVELLNNISDKNTKKVLTNFNKAIMDGYEVNRLIESIIAVVKDFIVFDRTKDPSLMVVSNKELLDKIKFSVVFAFEILDVFIKVSSDLKFSEVPIQVFELGLLQALSLKNEIFKKATNNKIDDIFQTQEIIKKESMIVQSQTKEVSTKGILDDVEDKPESIKEEIENTIELNLSQDVIKENEETREIEKEILNHNPLKNTDELNIGNLFSTDDTRQISKKEIKASYTADEIINLLVQANKIIHLQNKEKWLEKERASLPEDRQLINLLDRTNFISSSEDFLLLESHDESVISELNRIRKDENTIKFINKLFGRTSLLFAITKDEFDKIKNIWINLSQSNSLPEPTKIEKLELKKQENKAQEFGASIFGEIFKS